jgi:hypothetical protein
MSDGNEEREESRIRIEQERRENVGDRIDIDDVDEGEPERLDSKHCLARIPVQLRSELVVS